MIILSRPSICKGIISERERPPPQPILITRPASPHFAAQLICLSTLVCWPLLSTVTHISGSTSLLCVTLSSCKLFEADAYPIQHILAFDYGRLPASSPAYLPRRSVSCMATMHRQTSSPTKPARLAQSLRRAISVGHSQDRRQPPSRSISVVFAESSSACEHRASIDAQPRPSLHHRSASVDSAPTDILPRKRRALAFAGPSPALSPILSETPYESLGTPPPVPAPSVLGAVAEHSVVVVPGDDLATEMHAQVGVWEEQTAPGWAAYEHAVASVGVWEHESVNGASKDPFAPAAPSYIAGPRPTGAWGRRELAVNTLVSSNTAYIMASMASSLDSDSVDGSTLVANTPVSVSSPQDKRAPVAPPCLAYQGEVRVAAATCDEETAWRIRSFALVDCSLIPDFYFSHLPCSAPPRVTLSLGLSVLGTCSG